MNEEKIEALFQTIQKLPPEVEWNAIQQFIVMQPPTVYTAPTGGGGSSGLLGLKNGLIMITSATAVGVAIQILVSRGDSKPAVNALPANDSGKKASVYTNLDTAPRMEGVIFGPISHGINNYKHVPVDTSGEAKPIAFGCDDDKHIAKDFWEQMVKDQLIDAESFSFKMTASNLLIDGKKQDESVYAKYENMLVQKGISVNKGLRIAVQAVKCVCSININIDEDKNTDAPTLPEPPVNMANVNYSTEIVNAQNIELSPFSEIELSSEVYVRIVAGGTYGISCDDEKMLDKSLVEVRGDKLVIRTNYRGKNKENMITVTMPHDKLQQVTVLGSGAIHIESEFTGTKLLEVKSSGTIMVEKYFSTSDITMRVMGSGAIDVQDIFSDKITVEVMGSGSVSNFGNSKTLKASISGSGAAILDKLMVNDAEASVTGSGMIELQVNKKLNAEVSGSGMIYYYGNPSDVEKDITGSGEIQHKEKK